MLETAMPSLQPAGPNTNSLCSKQVNKLWSQPQAQLIPRLYARPAVQSSYSCLIPEAARSQGRPPLALPLKFLLKKNYVDNY